MWMPKIREVIVKPQLLCSNMRLEKTQIRTLLRNFANIYFFQGMSLCLCSTVSSSLVLRVPFVLLSLLVAFTPHLQRGTRVSLLWCSTNESLPTPHLPPTYTLAHAPIFPTQNEAKMAGCELTFKFVFKADKEAWPNIKKHLKVRCFRESLQKTRLNAVPTPVTPNCQSAT